MPYDASGELHVWAVDASTGALSWGGTDYTLPYTYYNYGGLPLASDGTRAYVIIGCRLAALNLSNGTSAWVQTVDSNGTTDCSPTDSAPVVSGGTVFAAVYSTTAAFDPATGAPKWHTSDGGIGTPAVSNGLIMFHGFDNSSDVLRALDTQTGQRRWVATGGIGSDPAVVGDLVLAPNGGSNVLGYDIRTGVAVLDTGTVSTNTVWTRPAIAGNRLFVPSADGTIRALGPP